MHALLDSAPHWYVLGPCLGLLVVGMLATLNTRLGVLGGWSETVEWVGGRRRQLGVKAWFALGVVAGGLVFRLAAGGPSVGEGYGWLTRELGSDVAVGAVLVGAGVLIGFGARLAGGCTSGNGLGGSSFGSPASLVATATFIGTAVVSALVIEALL
jgi:uncharacterized protein